MWQFAYSGNLGAAACWYDEKESKKWCEPKLISFRRGGRGDRVIVVAVESSSRWTSKLDWENCTSTMDNNINPGTYSLPLLRPFLTAELGRSSAHVCSVQISVASP